MTYAVQHPATKRPTWFNPTDNPMFDIDGLVRRLLDEADRRNDPTFTAVVHDIKIHGIVRAYDLGLGKFATIDAFAQKCAELTDWADQRTRALVDIHEERLLATYAASLPGLPQLAPEAFDAYVKQNGVKEVGKGGNHLEYDVAAAVTGEGIFTDHMGPCITVGLTALSADRTIRYNAILHSFNDAHGSSIMDALAARFDGGNVPNYATLTDVEYFVVGGAPEQHSRRKADQLLAELRDRNLRVRGVALTTHDAYKQKSKAVMVTAQGKVAWTYY